jgi:AraC-like DNA-binding protein
MKKLEELLTVEKIYRDPEINREQIAQRLGLDVQALSKQVNQYFKMSLPELVNHYRIAEAKERLKNSSATVKEIFYEAGFVSRSAFNTAFKKSTGLTPKEYRSPS